MRILRPALALLLLSACTGDSADTSFITGAPGETSAATSGTSTGGSTSGLPTTTAGQTSVDSSSSSSSSGEPETSSSSGEPETGSSSSSSSSSGEPETGTSSGTGSSSGSSSSGAGSHCEDGATNEDETDLDCGGATCPACVAGAGCLLDLDCETGWCDAGVCVVPGCLVDADCDDFDADCVESTCDALTKHCALAPANDGQACEDDGDLCTKGVCDKGGCLGELPLDCSGLDNFCGAGVCDPGAGACVVNVNPGSEGAACDDGYSCTPDDKCVSGVCGVGGPGYLFFEDFSAPAPGWELGPTWAIGAATASELGYNGADPAADHSPGPDEQLAGVAIGALVPAGEQATTCLSSPEIAALGEGPLWLTFWRHLHTDHFPFVRHTVEAFDGALWQELEVGYANPGIDDPAWTFLEYDISAYVGPTLRVRVCYSQEANAIAHAGWSLDDLTVGPYSCTP
jgi:hypothetical protein